MGKQIVIREQKFFNEFKNGENFTDALTDFTNNFTGLVMEKQKARFVLDVSWGFTASSSNSISAGGTTGRITKSSGDFRDDGFSVGDEIDLQWTDNSGLNYLFGANIDSMSGNTIYISHNTGPLPDSSVNGFVNASVIITCKTDLTALIWRFGLVENSNTHSTNNLITNSDQAYYGSSLDFTNWTNFQQLGSNKDWITGELRARRIATGEYGVQRFEVEHEIIIPFFEEGDDFVQQPDYLDGLNSIKYTFDAGFRTVLSNPDSEKNFIFDSSQGSVAYYDENYNGFNNIFSVDSVTYQEANTLASADGILASGRTLVTVTVNRLSGTFSNGGRFGIYLGYQAKADDYTNTPNSTFVENFIYDRELGLINLTTSSGDTFIYQCSANIVGSQLVITCEVEYTPQQKLFLSNELNNGEANFILSVLVGDSSLDNGNSNRVMLLADTGSYDYNADIPNLIKNVDMKIFTYKDVIGTDHGYSSVEQWIEDGIVVKGSFDININKRAFLNSLDFRLIAHNPTTNDFFTLDSYSFSILSAIISNGIQQLNFNNDRGYNLVNGSDFNKAILTTGSLNSGLQTYEFEIGQKISWQDWIVNNEVNTIFFDSSKENNNLNNKASNYSNLNDYEIKLALFSNVFGENDEGVSGNTDYLVVSPSLEINDYDQDGNPTPVWSGIITTINPQNNTDLQGYLMSGSDDTLFRITWSNSNGPVTDISDLSIIHRIEEAFQNGYDIDENGDTRNNPNNNRVINKNAFLEVDIYLDSGNVVSECLVKGSALNSNAQYSLSGKLINTNVEDPNGKLTSPDSIIKDTSGIVEGKSLAI